MDTRESRGQPGLGELGEAEQLRLVYRTAAIGTWQWDLASGQMHYSSRARSICGFTENQQITIEDARAVTHPDDRPITGELAKRALDPALRDVQPYIYRIVRADTGEVTWVQAHGEASFAEVDGQVRAVRYAGTIQDITPLRQAEVAQAESEARLRLALDAAEMAVWELDLATDRVTGSRELNRLCGFPEDANPTADELRARYAPGERERVQAEAQAILAKGGDRVQTVIRHIWPDGTEHDLLIRAQLRPSTTGQRVLGVLMDVSESRRREERLSAMARELRHRLQNMMALVGSLARNSFRAPASEAGLDDFINRVQALANVSRLMFRDDGDGDIELTSLVRDTVAPYLRAPGDPIAWSGAEVPVPAQLTSSIAMALHELCTNAVKHGALSRPQGRVEIDWTVEDGTLLLRWRESGGPEVGPPVRKGFGSRLLGRMLFVPPDHIEITYAPEGVRCTIRVAIAAAGPGS